MRYASAMLALGFVACAFGPVDAHPGYTDAICPEASQYVIAGWKLRRNDPAQRVYDVFQAMTDAYEQCSKRMLSNGFREPQHYADIRAARSALIVARALMAMNRLDAARRELTRWRPSVQQVVDWEAEAEGFASGDVSGAAGTNARVSRYHDSAKDAVAAIDAELAQIDALSHDGARRARPV